MAPLAHIPKAAEQEFWRAKCADSFWWFFKYCWGYDFNPKGALSQRPWLDEVLHRQLCDWFEEKAKEWLAARRAGLNKPMKIMAVVPRDFGKTTLLAAAGQTWLHLHDPELATYTGCEVILRAREILNGIKTVISGEDTYSHFAELYGDQKTQGRKWKVDGIVTAARTNLTRRDDSFGLWAVESGMVGLHPDGGFFDDPNTYERLARHHDWLDIVNQHLDTLIPVFQSDGFWCLTATRYGDGDHIGKSLRYEGCASMSGMPMPGVTPTPDGTWHVFFLDAEDADGNPTMPRIWPRERIDAFKARNMQKYFAQVRNNPSQSPHNILTREIIERNIIEPLDRHELKKLRVTLHMDTAFKNARRRTRGDRNVISAVGHEDKTGKCVFLGAKYSALWQSDEFLDQLIESVTYWNDRAARVVAITDEDDIGGKPGVWPAFLQSTFRTKGIRMPEVLTLRRRVDLRKEDRLREVAAFWRDGKMKLMRGAPGLDLLIDEMSKIGMSEYDDIGDATADCFHKDVYKVVWGSAIPNQGMGSSNPFDDVLKPGPVGDAAAEKIAAMYEERDRMYEGMRFDTVHP